MNRSALSVISLASDTSKNAKVLKIKWNLFSQYLATLFEKKEYERVCTVWNKSGKVIRTISSQATDFDWSSHGLSVAQGTNEVLLWTAENKATINTIEIGFNEAAIAVKWSNDSSLLAIGTREGSIVLFVQREGKKRTIAKNLRKIKEFCWSDDTILCVIFDNDQFNLYDAKGENLFSSSPKWTPKLITFHSFGLSSQLKQNSVSFVHNKTELMIVSLESSATPLELEFNEKYGEISHYCWFGDGEVMIGYNSGYFIVVSSQSNEIDEVFSTQLFNSAVTHVAFSPALSHACVCGENVIKVFQCGKWKNVLMNFSIEQKYGSPLSLSWSPNGQVVSCVTNQSNIVSFLTVVPTLCACYQKRMAYLSSLQQVSIVDYIEKKSLIEYDVDYEPTFIAFYSEYLALVENISVTYYNVEMEITKYYTKSYLGDVVKVSLNDTHSAVLINNGTVLLHPIDESESGKCVCFPEESRSLSITDVSLTKNFLVYSMNNDKRGQIVLYSIEDKTEIAVFQHTARIVRISPNPNGTRVAFIDTEGKGNLYNPVDGTVLLIPIDDCEKADIIWDVFDWSVFVVVKSQKAFVFVLLKQTLDNNPLRALEHTPFAKSFLPQALYEGELAGQDSSARIVSSVLKSHMGLLRNVTLNELDISQTHTLPEERKEHFHTLLRLNRLNDAKTILLTQCAEFNVSDLWTALANAALSICDVSIAAEAYRALGDAGMAHELMRISQSEQIDVRSALILALEGEFDKAQQKFMASAKPKLALRMRTDLRHWEQALLLAHNNRPEEETEIATEYAQQLEFKGEYGKALQQYNFGTQNKNENSPALAKAKAGRARMLIRTGDIYTGFDLAKRSNDIILQRDCALILMDIRVHDKAAELFQTAGIFDKAAELYVMMRNFTKADPIMNNVKSATLHRAYAEAKEEEGKFAIAERSYLIANDIESVVRIYLKTKREESAFKLIRETKHQNGAKMVADYCISKEKPEIAIEFLLLAQLDEEAFALAVDHNAMNLFAMALEGKGTKTQYAEIAKYYEENGDLFEAGKWRAQSGEYSRAIDLLLSPPGTDKAILLAIDIVGKTKNNKLTTRLLNYLMGDNDGKPKDPNFVFRLYFALGNYLQCARTAIIIANSEQAVGKLTLARTILVDAINLLRNKGIKVIPELKRNLVLVHSYFLAKIQMKLKNHENAARMMTRCAASRSRFASQVGPILVTAALECHKASLRKDAWDIARILTTQEYRDLIPEKYKTKIDAIVRHADKKQAEEATSPCPVCESPLANSELECKVCGNYLPACILTGYHMIIDDWCQTPCCNFPALHSKLLKYLQNNQECPLCSVPINPLSVIKEVNPKAILDKDLESVNIHSLNESDNSKNETK